MLEPVDVDVFVGLGLGVLGLSCPRLKPVTMSFQNPCVLSTWTPTVYKIMAFMAIIGV